MGKTTLIPRWPIALAALCVAGCAQLAEGNPGEPDPSWTVQVTVTNTGDGFGTVAIMFPFGTPDQPCSGELAPGASCTSAVTATIPIPMVSLEARSSMGSDFMAWGGACQGASEDCMIEVPEEPNVRLTVEAPFMLDMMP